MSYLIEVTYKNGLVAYMTKVNGENWKTRLQAISNALDVVEGRTGIRNFSRVAVLNEFLEPVKIFS